jgi:hypothetical protein
MRELATVREELELCKVEQEHGCWQGDQLFFGTPAENRMSPRPVVRVQCPLLKHLRSTKSKLPRTVGGSKRGFFLGEKDRVLAGNNLGTPSNDDDVIDDEVVDTTEENQCCLQLEWNAGTEEMSYHEQKET